MGVAIRRAAHQLVDVPPVLSDPIAVRLVATGYRGRWGARRTGGAGFESFCGGAEPVCGGRAGGGGDARREVNTWCWARAGYLCVSAIRLLGCGFLKVDYFRRRRSGRGTACRG